LLAILYVIVKDIFAQWNPTGTHIYNSNGGNVGIGTASPTSTFLAFGTQSYPLVTSNSGIFNTNNASGVQLTFGAISSSPYPTWIQTEDHTNGGNYYALSFNHIGGNVGIGRVSPFSFLHVAVTITTDNGTAGIVASGTTPGLIPLTCGTNRPDFISRITQLIDASRPTMFTITLGGVGIGTDNPLDLLSVSGTIRSKKIKLTPTLDAYACSRL
jgi:hypothetical protein